VKVLFVTASYPTVDGPAVGIFVKEHARAAAEHNEVAIIHLERAEVARVTVVREPDDEFPTWRATYPRHPAPISYSANVAAASSAYRRVRQAGFDPDVLHAHFFLAGVPAVLLGRVRRKPVVITEQWSIFLPEDPSTLGALPRRAAKFAFTHADMVLPVSAALRDGIVANGIDARFRIVPNVFDEQLFYPDAATRVRARPAQLLSVGAMYEAKGYDDLLEAVAILARRRRDFRLDIVGHGGELLPEYEALRARLGIDDVVSFVGLRPKEEVAARMRASDVFVITSRYDSNPCALIEALASGVPVVATAVGGIPDMVRNGSGLLAKPHDPDDIALQLDAALDRAATFDRGAIAADARARYGRATVGRAFAEVYDEVVARRR
jgi:glycosyltransferase involved in cell wall biosynthesis